MLERIIKTFMFCPHNLTMSTNDEQRMYLDVAIVTFVV